ncbi:MAG: hypothetical protein ACJA00_004834 [Myxococcota bacterium]
MNDEMLNSVLFLLIGLEVLVLRFETDFAWLMAVAVPLALVAHLAAVSAPVLLLGRFSTFARGTIPILAWGGLRGGISVALALSLPEVAEKSAILAATYTVVIFTLTVQGMSTHQNDAVLQTGLRSPRLFLMPLARELHSKGWRHRNYYGHRHYSLEDRLSCGPGQEGGHHTGRPGHYGRLGVGARRRDRSR